MNKYPFIDSPRATSDPVSDIEIEMRDDELTLPPPPNTDNRRSQIGSFRVCDQECEISTCISITSLIIFMILIIAILLLVINKS